MAVSVSGFGDSPLATGRGRKLAFLEAQNPNLRSTEPPMVNMRARAIRPTSSSMLKAPSGLVDLESTSFIFSSVFSDWWDRWDSNPDNKNYEFSALANCATVPILFNGKINFPLLYSYTRITKLNLTKLKKEGASLFCP